jgi:electron transfer flavoprotein alpha subunit
MNLFGFFVKKPKCCRRFKMATGILVVVEHEGGQPKKTAYELLTKACQVASETGGSVSALVIGSDSAADLGNYGAETVYTVSGGAFETFTSEAWTAGLSAAIEQADPAFVFAPSSSTTRDYFPRLAARKGLGLATEVTQLDVVDGKLSASRPIYAGKVLVQVAVRSTPALYTSRPNAFGAGTATGGTANVVALSVDAGAVRANVTEQVQASSDVADLTEADRIVSGGRSLKSEESFNSVIVPLAQSIGATPGASRAAVDAGYAPHSWQVGQTGKVVNPSLYIACGISGAIQHLAGMRTSKVIVAVNKDPEAPIFQHATYGIVEDLFEVCPALQKAFSEAL